jgi:hypothetical protein
MVIEKRAAVTEPVARVIRRGAGYDVNKDAGHDEIDDGRVNEHPLQSQVTGSNAGKRPTIGSSAITSRFANTNGKAEEVCTQEVSKYVVIKKGSMLSRMRIGISTQITNGCSH